MDCSIWTSPDGDIVKNIVSDGNWGSKPTENCKCFLEIVNSNSVPILNAYSPHFTFTIGHYDTKFERLLDRCLITMHRGESTQVTFQITKEESIEFSLKLLNFHAINLIHEWEAQKKYELALEHKTRGIELYNHSRHVDASHRFIKGLKILCSIPIEVDTVPSEIDGVSVTEIDKLKTIFYNNLASCYLKEADYEIVLKLCKCVFERDENNVKALYKQAIAKCETRDYEGSQDSLLHLLMQDPQNKAASEKLKYVNVKVAEGNTRINNMIKKMFT